MIAENAKVHRDQQALFSNEKNKTHFNSILTTHLQDIGHHVEVCRGDADTLIVSSSLEFAPGQIVTVVAENTYIFVIFILVYH